MKSYAPLFFFIIFLCLIRWQGNTLITQYTPYGIINFELATSMTEVKQIQQLWNEKDFKLNTYIDFGFIISYVWFFFTLFKITAAAFEPVFWRNIGEVLMRLIFLAGILDIAENLFLLNHFAGNYTLASIKITFIIAVLKFLIIIVGMLYLLVSLLIISRNKK